MMLQLYPITRHDITNSNINALVKSYQLPINDFFRGRFPLRQVEKVDCKETQAVVFSRSQKYLERLTFYEGVNLDRR